jgi:hypothetical protein
MGDPDDEALEDALARARDRAERYGVWLEHLRGGGPAFAEASALYPPDMSEWQSPVCLLTGNVGVWRELGGRVMQERSIGPVIEDLDSPRRPWASSQDAVMRWAGHSGMWSAGRRSSATCSSGSSSTAGSRRAICANVSRPRSRSLVLGHEA